MNKIDFDPNYNGDLYSTELPYAVNFTNNGFVWLDNLKKLPAGTKFNNNGYVSLYYLTELTEGIEFNNKGNVYLDNLKTLPKGFKFNNKGNVNLWKLTKLPKDFKFNNEGCLYFYHLNFEELSYEQFMNIYPKLGTDKQIELKWLLRQFKIKRILNL